MISSFSFIRKGIFPHPAKLFSCSFIRHAPREDASACQCSPCPSPKLASGFDACLMS